MFFHQQTFPEKVKSRVSEMSEYVSDFSSNLRDIDVSDSEAAQALGWASVGIGLAEIAATRQVQTLLGLDDTPESRGVLRVLGVRELMHGVSLLSENDSERATAAGLWGRVAGDVLDTALLGAAAAKTRRPLSFGLVSLMVMGIGLADMYFAQRVTRKHA
jgi:hypothetical protein